MTQLIAKGKVVRGYIGLSMQPITPDLAHSFHLPSTQGALVAQVMSDGPADKAGLQPGDFIVAVDGEKISNPNDLRNTVANLSPGQTVPVEFYRNGKVQTAEITVGRLAEQPASPRR